MKRRSELIIQATIFLEKASVDSAESERWIGEAIKCLQQAARSEGDGLDGSEASRRRLI
jgi:hypothetical protein